MKTFKFTLGAIISFTLLFAITGSALISVGLLIVGALVSASIPKGITLLLINPGDLTWNGREVMDIAETIMEDAFNNPTIDEFHTVLEGIVAKQQIGYLGILTKLTKVDAGCGSSADTTKNIPMTEKFWNPVSMEIWLELCYQDLESSFFIWGQNKGFKRPDLISDSSKVVQFVLERMSEAALEDSIRIAWFGDTAALNVVGGGNITNGVAIADYTQIDGFWKQIFAIVAVTPAQKTSIPENALTPLATQLALSADRAIVTMRAMLQDSDKRLKGANDKIFILTDTLVDNYQTFLESQAVNKSFEKLETVQSGLTFTGLFFRNIPIYRFDLQDRTIIADFSDGTVVFLPHRAVLSTKANLAIGVDSKVMINSFESWLERKDKKVNLRGGYKMDVKVVRDYMIQAGY